MKLERWRLTKNQQYTIEWDGRPASDSIPVLAQGSCFMERDYETAKSGPVEWYCSGNWKFEEITPQQL